MKIKKVLLSSPIKCDTKYHPIRWDLVDGATVYNYHSESRTLPDYSNQVKDIEEVVEINFTIREERVNWLGTRVLIETSGIYRVSSVVSTGPMNRDVWKKNFPRKKDELSKPIRDIIQRIDRKLAKENLEEAEIHLKTLYMTNYDQLSPERQQVCDALMNKLVSSETT